MDCKVTMILKTYYFEVNIPATYETRDGEDKATTKDFWRPTTWRMQFTASKERWQEVKQSYLHGGKSCPFITANFQEFWPVICNKWLFESVSAELTANMQLKLEEQCLAQPGTVKDVTVFTSTGLGTFLVYRKKLCPFYTITIPMEAGSLQQSQQLRPAMMSTHNCMQKKQGRKSNWLLSWYKYKSVYRV